MGSFQKTVEDFTCDHCGTTVKGSGYTNHCPQCLWSKHVDIKPGDRAETCGGAMKPIAIEGSTPKYIIVHVCEKCSVRRNVRLDDNDNPEALLGIAKARAARS